MCRVARAPGSAHRMSMWVVGSVVEGRRMSGAAAPIGCAHTRQDTRTHAPHTARQSGAARAGNSPGGGFAGNHTHHSRQRAPQDTRLHTRQGHKHSAQHPHTFAYHNHIAHAAGLLTHSRPIALTHPTSARAMRPNAPLSTPPPPLRCAPTGGRTGCRRAKCARGADGAASGQNADSPA